MEFTLRVITRQRCFQLCWEDLLDYHAVSGWVLVLFGNAFRSDFLSDSPASSNSSQNIKPGCLSENMSTNTSTTTYCYDMSFSVMEMTGGSVLRSHRGTGLTCY